VRWAVLLGLLFASMVVGCRDEDLDDVERASRVEAARAEAARLHEGVTFEVQAIDEMNSVAPLSAGAGFDVVVPRGLPDGIEVRWVMATPPIDEPSGGETSALVGVTMQARGRLGALQLSEQEGRADPHAAGEPVAIGDITGLLSYPAGEGSGSPFSTLTFEGCGLQLGLGPSTSMPGRRSPQTSWSRSRRRRSPRATGRPRGSLETSGTSS